MEILPLLSDWFRLKLVKIDTISINIAIDLSVLLHWGVLI
jgi:hypothetical protein